MNNDIFSQKMKNDRMNNTTKHNWKKSIKLNLLLLKCGGLWPKGNGEYKFNWYTVHAIVSLLFFLLTDIVLQIYKLFLLENLEEITGIIFVIFTKIGGIFKVYYLIQNMTTLKKLVKEMNEEMFQPKSAEQQEMVQNGEKSWRLLFKCLWGTSLTAIIFWAVFPILDKSYKNFQLPFIGWYPLNTKKAPQYQFVYVYQIVSIFYNALCNLNVDTLISALNMFIGVQFEIFCNNLKNLDTVRPNVAKFVSSHRKILKFAQKSSTFFNWIVLVQFFVSAISIGVTMFLLTVVPLFTSQFYCLLFFKLAISTQTFMYCWFGNEVEYKSNQITYAIFECDWIKFPKKTKDELLILGVNCQEPLKLSALNLFYLTVATFLRIMRTAWSYCTLLLQLSGP